MSRPYAVLVKEGREAVQGLHELERGASPLRWKLGDLAIEHAGEANGEGRGGRRDRDPRLATYAKDIGCGYVQLVQYRSVATTFQTNSRKFEIDIPWTTYREIHLSGFRGAEAIAKLNEFVAWCQARDRAREKGPRYGLRQVEEFLDPDGEPTPQYAEEDRVPQARRALKDMPAEHAEAVITEAITKRPEVRPAVVREMAADPAIRAEVVREIARDPKATSELIQAVQEQVARERGIPVEPVPLHEQYWEVERHALDILRAINACKSHFGDDPAEFAALFARSIDPREYERWSSDLARGQDWFVAVVKALRTRRLEVVS